MTGKARFLAGDDRPPPRAQVNLADADSGLMRKQIIMACNHRTQVRETVREMLGKTCTCKYFPLVVSILSLLIAGMLYLGFRPASLLMFEWVNFVGLDGLVANYRAFISPSGPQLPEWLIFSAPNGLWLFSFAGLMMYLWGQEQFASALAWTSALWVVGISSELLQSVHFLPGVFDINDVYAYTTGFLAYFVLTHWGFLYEQ